MDLNRFNKIARKEGSVFYLPPCDTNQAKRMPTTPALSEDEWDELVKDIFNANRLLRAGLSATLSTKSEQSLNKIKKHYRRYDESTGERA